MNAIRTIVGVLLIALGVAALVYGGFDSTKATHHPDLGPLKFQVKERERIEIPAWAGVTSVVVGTGVLLLARRRD